MTAKYECDNIYPIYRDGRMLCDKWVYVLHSNHTPSNYTVTFLPDASLNAIFYTVNFSFDTYSVAVFFCLFARSFSQLKEVRQSFAFSFLLMLLLLLLKKFRQNRKHETNIELFSTHNQQSA